MHLESSGRVRPVSRRSIPSRRLSRHRGPVYRAIAVSGIFLHAPFLRRTTSVVGYRGHIRNTGNLESRVVQGSNGRLSSWAWSFHHYFQILQAIFRRRFAGPCGSYLGCERGTFSGALESTRTGGGPSECITLTISNGNQRIVERSMHMGYPITDGATNPLLCPCFRSGHRSAMSLGYFLMGLRGPFLERPFVCVRCPRTGSPRRWRIPR